MKKKENNVVRIKAAVAIDEENIPKRVNVRQRKRRIMLVLLVVALAAVGSVYAVTQLQTYTSVQVIQDYSEVNVANSSFESFLTGILKYGRDGVSYINKEGETVWNYAYQISNPLIATTDGCAVIADVNGNSIVVVDKDGVKGEIETILPIEKVAVSEQGIVAALVKDGTTPQIICYDAVGNILVEHKVSSTGTGYPVGLSISPDGTVLLVSYLQVTETGMSSTYSYYNFANEDLVSSSVVLTETRSDTVISEVKFLNDTVSVIIGETQMLFYEGTTELQLIAQIELEKTVQSIFYGDEKVGMIIANDDGSKELRVYNASGAIVLSEIFTGEYKNACIVSNQIIVYDGYECLIYSMQGVLKFSGQMEMEISGVFPMFGINKYVIIGSEGMKEIRLVR